MCFNSFYFFSEMHLSGTQEDPFPPASYLITVVLSTDEWAVAAQALAICHRTLWKGCAVSVQKLADRMQLEIVDKTPN